MKREGKSAWDSVFAISSVSGRGRITFGGVPEARQAGRQTGREGARRVGAADMDGVCSLFFALG